MLMLFRSRPRALSARPTRPYRPSLEVLEDRWVPSAGFFLQTNLVADEPGVALIHDPQLVNAWGVSLSPTGGAFWVSANGTGVSTLYTGDFTRADGTLAPFAKAALTVTIPGGQLTGQVFNPFVNSSPNDFVVTNGTISRASIFIFASDTGFITGWNPAVPPATLARPAVSTPGTAAYTGLAIANNGTANFLYAADFQNGEIDVFLLVLSAHVGEAVAFPPSPPAQRGRGDVFLLSVRSASEGILEAIKDPRLPFGLKRHNPGEGL